MANDTQVQVLANTLMGNNATPSTDTGPGMSAEALGSPFDSVLKEQLTRAQRGIATAQSDVDSLFAGAVDTLKKGAESGAGAIATQYERLKGYQSEENRRTMDTALESQRGFAQNTALLTQIQETGERALNDLEQRKQELILSGNAQASREIANLQVQQASFILQNRQQAFQNLLSLAGLGMQEQGLSLQKKSIAQSAYEFERTMQSRLGDISLQYGVKLEPGDTLESVVNRAYPKADAMNRLKMDEMRAGIAAQNAQTALANLQYSKETKNTEELDAIADGMRVYGMDSSYGQSALEALTKSGDLGALRKALIKATTPTVFSDRDLVSKAIMYKSSGADLANALLEIDNDVTIQNKDRAKEITRLQYGQGYTPDDTLSNFLSSFGTRRTAEDVRYQYTGR